MFSKSITLVNTLAVALVSTSVTAGVVNLSGALSMEGFNGQSSIKSEVKHNGAIPFRANASQAGEIKNYFGPDNQGPFESNGIDSANPKLYGKTYAEWTAEWWKWALQYPVDRSPITDTTGELCNLGQSGPVWFLAGTNNTSTERNCSIPAGKAIFYPLVNVVWADCPNSSDQDWSDKDVGLAMAFYGDAFYQVTSSLDTFSSNIFSGDLNMPVPILQLPTVRIQSPVFQAILPENHYFKGLCLTEIPAGKSGRMVSDGYWVMLPPLKKGEHLMMLHGAAYCSDFLAAVGWCSNLGEMFFETGVTYHLNIGIK